MELKGWKGFFIGVAVVGVIILSFVMKMMPHSVSGGKWEIEAKHFALTQVRASQQGHMKLEFIPEGPAENFMACVMEEANASKLATEDPRTIPMITSQEGTGAVTFSDVVLNPGNYAVVVINLGDKKVTMQYKITETKLH